MISGNTGATSKMPTSKVSSSCSRRCRSARSSGWRHCRAPRSTKPRRRCADAATALLHGADAARVAAETARQTFEEGAIDENLPTVEISRAELEAGAGVLALFVKAGLVASNGEARRQIKGGGLRVNDAAVTDEKLMLKLADLTPEGVVKLSLGKKRHVLLKPA